MVNSVSIVKAVSVISAVSAVNTDNAVSVVIVNVISVVSIITIINDVAATNSISISLALRLSTLPEVTKTDLAIMLAKFDIHNEYMFHVQMNIGEILSV